MKEKRLTKAEKIFNYGLNIAIKNDELHFLNIFIDSTEYNKKLKLQIIEIATKNGFEMELDKTKLFNSHSKRYFTCNNIIWKK